MDIINQVRYGVVCEFSDETERSFEIMIDELASEAEFLFFALSYLSNDERRKLKNLGCLRIHQKGDSDMLKPPYHWLIKSQMLDVNQYHFVA